MGGGGGGGGARQVRHSNSPKFEIKDSNERVRAWQCFKHLKIPKKKPLITLCLLSLLHGPYAETVGHVRGKELRGILLQ